MKVKIVLDINEEVAPRKNVRDLLKLLFAVIWIREWKIIDIQKE